MKPRIGIIGNGNVGSALARGLEHAGYAVRTVGSDSALDHEMNPADVANVGERVRVQNEKLGELATLNRSLILTAADSRCREAHRSPHAVLGVSRASLQPYIAQTEGRIHFAGEHASSVRGWMQGALESGRRVASQIAAA